MKDLVSQWSPPAWYSYFTKVTIDFARQALDTFKDSNGDVGADGWAQWRENRGHFFGGRPEIEYSFGLETLLTSVVGHVY